MSIRKLTSSALAVAAALLGLGVARADDEGLEQITVTATRQPETAASVPASISAVPIELDAPGINASESLLDVPGLMARDRQNYAQDEQISIRGFGARAAVGVQGVRVYQDGIPMSQPDGQGQVSQFNLTSAERIEVLRGPFSALYGNASGGVIQLFTADGQGPLQVRAGLGGGSFGTWREDIDLSGSEGRVAYNMGFTNFNTDGARGHSAAHRMNGQGKWGFDFGHNGKLTLLFNYYDLPSAQDALGLTRLQFNQDPYQAAPPAVIYNTRKSASQSVEGAIYELPLGEYDTLRVMAYLARRDVLQFLAIPVSTQKLPTSSGGVVVLATSSEGVEPRWTHRLVYGHGEFDLIAGLAHDVLSQQREGFENYIGQTLGVLGPLQRNEIDDENDFDQYLQLQWRTDGRWSAMAGVRHSALHFSSDDLFILPKSPNGSGTLAYGSTTPVIGVDLALTPHWNTYVSFGNGFETPTLNQLAYQAGGAPGLNTALRAAHTNTLEAGLKGQYGPRAHATLAVFRTNADDEIVVASSAGGRTTYTNVGQTRRWGAEAGTSLTLTSTLRAEAAITWLDAYVITPYEYCATTPCTVPNTAVPAGSRIPGIAEQQLYAGLRWAARPRWNWLLQERYVSKVYANDVNTAYAGAYALLDLATDMSWSVGRSTLRAFVRGSNLLNRHYAGSVIVNDANGRYFEAGPGASVFAGVTLTAR